MELVFRNDASSKDAFYDLYTELGKDASVKFTIRAKNGTGSSSFTLTAEEVDLLLDIREKVREE